MAEANDIALLREFAGHNSETAFAELVRRHINLVYSVARRFTGNDGDAQDVTQAVFIILARKAASLSGRTVLTGWLYETTRFTASRLLRSQARRRAHEQEASMQSILDEPDPDDLWCQLAPHLEAAMSRLGERDRALLALRYYENKTGAEAAALLGIREEAARKRTNRALEKLRRSFLARGVTSTTAAIASAISANSLQVAPAALVKTVTAAAVAKGAAAPISTLTLIKGALKIMAWTKAKAAITTGAIILLTAGTTTIVVKRIGSPSVDESLWSVNSANLAKAPPVLIIRPTRYPNRVGSVDDGDKVIGLNMPISALFIRAYGPDVSAARMILPPAVARRHYDLMLTLPRHATESLREKLKTQLGLVGQREIVQTNVLCLKVKDTDRFESSISKGGSPVGYMTSDASFAKLIVTNQPVSFLATQLESLLHIPTIDQTGVAGTFDINLKWHRNDPRHDSLKNALSNQLGLELVPANMPVQMLVVKKAN